MLYFDQFFYCYILKLYFIQQKQLYDKNEKQIYLTFRLILNQLCFIFSFITIPYTIKLLQKLHPSINRPKQSTIKQKLMKKHLTSIQSTRPQDDGSIFSYDDRQTKFNYKVSLQKLFDKLSEPLKLRSYLLYRDYQNIFQGCSILFQKSLGVYSIQQFWQKAFDDKNKDQKIHQKDQIALLVKMVLELDKKRKSAANQGRPKQFQTIKGAIEFLQQKTAEYQQKIRRKKYEDKLSKRLKQQQQKQKTFQLFQDNIKKTIQAKHNHAKQTFLENLHNESRDHARQTQKNTIKMMYKAKPSKFLSQAKDLSLRVKLAPYAAQLKRSYDYKTLQHNLSKTVDLDMSRKLSLISQMKQKQRNKIHSIHKKRYSVLSDRLNEQKNLTQKQLNHQKLQLKRLNNNALKKLQSSDLRKQYSRINSLQRSFNAYNMHSDSKQIKRILRNHKQTVQFSNEISQVSNLRTSEFYDPSYGTLTNAMLQNSYVQNDMRRQKQHQKKILRKFNKNNKSIGHIDSDEQADDICGSNKKTIQRQNSLVALYDNDLNQLK